MSEKSLLARLEEKEIDFREMIENNRDFTSSYFGSSSGDGGHLNYTEEQVKILFASVPNIFSYDWKPKSGSFDDLTKEQLVVMSIIHEVKSHPAYTMRVGKISLMISSGKYYAERNDRELYLESKLLTKPKKST